MARNKGFKPRNQAHLDKLLASGEVGIYAMHAPEVFIHFASEDTFAKDDNGKFITGDLPLWLNKHPQYRIRESKKFWRTIEEFAKGILRFINHPAAIITARALKINPGPARLTAEALADDDDKMKALRLIALYGPRDVQRWSEAIQDFLAKEGNP